MNAGLQASCLEERKSQLITISNQDRVAIASDHWVVFSLSSSSGINGFSTGLSECPSIVCHNANDVSFVALWARVERWWRQRQDEKMKMGSLEKKKGKCQEHGHKKCHFIIDVQPPTGPVTNQWDVKCYLWVYKSIAKQLPILIGEGDFFASKQITVVICALSVTN